MKDSFNKFFKFAPGFTLIEIIAVLVIISIIAVVAGSRVGGMTDTATDSSAAGKLRAHLRYAQIRALNTQGVWGIRCTGAAYNLYRWDGSAEITAILPGEENTSVSFPGGTSITALVAFDDWGRPHTSQDATGNTAGAALVMGGETVIVTRETGYVP